nr:MAG TPA: hypothetical protein [Caudoviricetes sp.]
MKWVLCEVKTAAKHCIILRTIYTIHTPYVKRWLMIYFFVGNYFVGVSECRIADRWGGGGHSRQYYIRYYGLMNDAHLKTTRPIFFKGIYLC